MRDPFAGPSRRPWFVPAGTSMLEEARLVAERHAAEKSAASDLESRIEEQGRSSPEHPQPGYPAHPSASPVSSISTDSDAPRRLGKGHP